MSPRVPVLRRCALSLTVLLLAAPLARADDSAETVTDLASASYQGTVAAGDHLALRVRPADKTVTAVEVTTNTLDLACTDALARTPTWLQLALREALRTMDAKDQQAYCKLVGIDASDKTVDEVAFVVAHLSPQDRQYATPALVKRNAELIYEIDPVLGYVDLVEKGTTGKNSDFHTTAKYRVKQGGAVTTFELPRDLYYWWVVHPMLDMELVTTVDPQSGQRADPPKGVFWREFLLAKPGDTATPATHYIQKAPNKLTDAELAKMSFGAADATASLRPSLVGPNEVVRAGSSGEPVLVHFSPSGGTCNSTYPMPDGIYLVTTIPLEQAALAGDDRLLENVVMAGPGRGLMRGYDMVSTSKSESRKFLIVRDRVPYGAATDPNETVIKDNGYSYDVMTSTQFDALVASGKLSRDASGAPCTKDTDCKAASETCKNSKCTLPGPYYNLNYNKIIVPSDQPRALFQVLAKHKTRLERFVKLSGVLQVHGSTRAADDWSDLTLPGGFKSTKQDSASALTGLKLYGNALLRDVVKGVDLLWTGVRRCSRAAKSDCPHGDRPMKQGDDAMDRIGWWSGQMLDRSVVERRCLSGGSKAPERSWYPQRIVVHHYGNCGEIQDVVGAASRAVLVPSMLTLSVEDHVWNEFYGGDGWYPYDTGWSDAPMRIGAWNVSGDGDAGGGKENAVMLGWRGDGQVVNLLGRYKARWDSEGKIDYEYTQHLDVEVTVTDAAGAPVDGAVVTFLTENYYINSGVKGAVKATFGVTGRDGKTTVTVGDKRNFAVNVATKLGHYPRKLDLSSYYVDNPAQMASVLTKDQGKPGALVKKTFVLKGKDGEGNAYTAVPVVSVSEKSITVSDKTRPYYRLELTAGAPAEYRSAYNPMNSRNFIDTASPGAVDVFVTDAAGYAAFKSDQAFSAVLVKRGVGTAQTVKLDLPPDVDEWVVVLSNRTRVRFGQAVSATAALKQVTPRQDTTDPPPDPTGGNDETGCSCAVATRGHSPAGSALLLVTLTLALAIARRRRRIQHP